MAKGKRILRGSLLSLHQGSERVKQDRRIKVARLRKRATRRLPELISGTVSTFSQAVT